jgi:hypothetical protein
MAADVDDQAAAVTALDWVILAAAGICVGLLALWAYQSRTRKPEEGTA